MSELTVPRMDFSALGELPDIYRNAQMESGRELSLAKLGQGASMADVQKEMLAQGDLRGALSLAQLQKATQPELTAEARNYQYGLQNPGFAQHMEQQKQLSRANSYGLNPIYGTDSEGNPVLLQIGSGGQAVQTKMPPGVRISTGVEKTDLGDRFALTDKRSGALIGYEPKNIAGAAAQKAIGEATGKAQVDFPKTLAQADGMLNTIEGILNDPALPKATGWLSIMQSVPGTDAYRFGTRISQIEGQAFLQAFESLKGGGQITEIEGQKATQAIGRLASAQRAEDYREALNELKQVIMAGKERARRGITVNAPASGSVAPTSRVWGDREAEAAGLYEPQQATQTQARSAQMTQPRQAPDGNFYIPDPSRPGKYLMVKQ